jgi:hypothetical protein
MRVWATPGALCAAADFPQSPTGLAQEYSKRQSLTVFLRPQVLKKYSVVSNRRDLSQRGCHFVLKRYSYGAGTNFHNSASVLIQSRTLFHALPQISR